MLQWGKYYLDVLPLSEQCSCAETSLQERRMLIYRDTAGRATLTGDLRGQAGGFGLGQLRIFSQLTPVSSTFSIFTPELTSPSPLSVYKPLVRSFRSQPCFSGLPWFNCTRALSPPYRCVARSGQVCIEWAWKLCLFCTRNCLQEKGSLYTPSARLGLLATPSHASPATS
jgi:hypothetical protein